MRPYKIANMPRRTITFATTLSVLLVLGCSSKSPSEAAPEGKTTVAKAKTNAKGTVRQEKSVAAEPPAKSVFNASHTARDPFFPGAKKAVVETTTSSQPKTAVDVIALLQQGFQGVIGAGEKRIALINNIMLEPGRQTEIPVGHAADKRNVPVRCREVSRDSVLLEVQGYAQPIRIAEVAR